MTEVGRSLGPIPLNGMADAHIGCLDVRLDHTSTVLNSLAIGDAPALDDVTVKSHMPVTGCFFVDQQELQAIEAFLAGAAVAEGKVHLVIDEENQLLDEVVKVEVRLQDSMLYLDFPIGITKYGYHTVTDVDMLPTGDNSLDELFREATLILPQFTRSHGRCR